MKIWLLTSILLMLTTASKNCSNKKINYPQGCFKGKLEIKGDCMNYTIGVTGGDMDQSKIASSWTDENTGKTYRDVFALGSRCTFPDSISVGDDFYFSIDTTSVQDCMVCMSYYPVPAKKLSIKILSAPCVQQ